jgi:hypothetical protein
VPGTTLDAILKALGPAAYPPVSPIIQDRWFKDETINIDGYTFQRCRFDRCKLITDWATFSFEHSFISPDCTLYFNGPALKTARLLIHHMRLGRRFELKENELGLAATINSDGTFTLK